MIVRKSYDASKNIDNLLDQYGTIYAIESLADKKLRFGHLRGYQGFVPHASGTAGKEEIGMKRPQSPCIGCKDRQIGCHTGCKAYAEFKAEVDTYSRTQLKRMGRKQ